MSEIKTLFAQSLHYLTGRTMIMAAGFVSFPILTRIFSVSDYGLLNLINTTLFLAIALGKLGLPNSIVRFYAEFKSSNKLEDFYSTVLITSVVSAATFASLFFISARIVLRHRITDYLLDIITLASILVFTGCVSDVLLSFQRAEQRTRLFNSINVFRRYTSLGLSIFFVLFLIKGLYGFYVGKIIAGTILLAGLLLLFFTDQRTRSLKYSSAIFKPSLKYGFPIIWAELGHNLLNYADRYLIQFYLGSIPLGLYGAGYNLATHVTEVLIYPLNYAMTPIYMDILVNKGKQETREFFTKMFTYFLLVLIPLLFGFIAVGRDLIIFLASSKYADSATILPYVIIGQAIYACSILLNSGLFIAKKTYIVTSIMTLTCVLNIGLNIILIPYNGILGAAQATLISFAVYTVIVVYYAFKEFSFRIDYQRIVVYFISSIVMYLAIGNITLADPLFNLVAKVGTGTILFSFLVFVFDANLRYILINLLRPLHKRF